MREKFCRRFLRGAPQGALNDLLSAVEAALWGQFRLALNDLKDMAHIVRHGCYSDGS